jgi:hypothetical protein
MRTTTKLFLALLIVGSLTACTTSKSLPTPTPTRSTPTAVFKKVTFYFVGDTPKGFLLFPETQKVFVTGSLLTSVLGDLISGKILPTDPNYFNLWKFGSKLGSISIIGTTATIDFVTAKLNVGSEIEMRAIDQLLWTLTEMDPAIKSLHLTIAGKSIETLAGHVDTRGTFKREPSYEVLNSVSIFSLSQNQSVTNPMVITGQACTFEAAVAWELIRDAVTPYSYANGSTMAKTTCPNRSSWSVSLPHLENGKYTFIVRDISPKDGAVVAFDDKDFTVG